MLNLFNMFKGWWQYRKEPKPTVSVYIDYYREDNMFYVYAFPEDAPNEQLIALLYYATDQLEQKMIEEEQAIYRAENRELKRAGHLTLIKG